MVANDASNEDYEEDDLGMGPVDVLDLAVGNRGESELGSTELGVASVFPNDIVRQGASSSLAS